MVTKNAIFWAFTFCSLLALIGSMFLSTTSVLANERTPIKRLPGHYDVLLNAYMNSGSTLTGRLLGFRRNVFYFYEPLWRLTLWSYYRSNSTMCSTRQASCRRVLSTEVNRNRPIPGRKLEFQVLSDVKVSNALEIPQKILELLYKCRLIPLRNLVQPGVTDDLALSGPSWHPYIRCQGHKRSIHACLTEMEQVCLTSTHRVSKVLRITLSSLETLLANNPRLKVLHLFRDPRAIIHSRLETKNYPLNAYSPHVSKSVTGNAKSLCDKMALDLREGQELLEKFPHRVKFVHYENLLGDVHNNINTIYDWLGMSRDRWQVDRLFTRNTNQPIRRDPLTESARKTNNAYWWRRFMRWKDIEAVDTVCSDILRQLGYPVFHRESDVRNMSNLASSLRFKFVL